MESIASFEALMEEKIGLAVGSIGEPFFQKVVARRMAACRISNANDYLHLLQTSPRELNEMIEELTIPETWFFRNRKQLEYLSDQIKSTWLLNKSGQCLRILSIPCATGEEPYTIAMILFDIGLLPERFHIDAADVSSYVLKKANAALFDSASFRGDDLSFRDRYFEKELREYRLLPAIRDTVTFMKGNIIDETFLKDAPAYDIIFCRNLFIYLSVAAKKKAANIFHRLLNHNGILFMGHTEEYPFEDLGMERIRQPGVFAYRRCNSTRTVSTPKVKEQHLKPKKTVVKKITGPDYISFPDRDLNSAVVKKIPDRLISHSSIKKKIDNDQTELLDLFKRARYLADQGELDSALSLCEEIIKRNNGFAEAYFLQGVICGAMDENNRAGDCFNRVLYLDPGHMDAMRHLLFIAEQAGDLKKALRIKERMERVRNKTEVD